MSLMNWSCLIDVGDALSYTARLSDNSALPAWLSFDAATQTFSGTPGNAEVGVVDVKVTVSDGSGATVSDVFSLSVNIANNSPVVSNAIADQQATEDTAFSFTIPTDSFTDIDADDVLSYSASLSDNSALPTWLSFDAATQTFSGTPGNAEVGILDIKVTASDGATIVSDSFSLNISNVNDAPVVANVIANQQVTEDAEFIFTVPAGSFTDIDAGDVLSYSASLSDDSVLPAWLSFDTATQTFSGTPGNAEVGVVDVKVTASDGTTTVSDNFALNINNVNDSPVVSNAIADQQATEDTAFSFTIPTDSFTDIDVSDTLTYSITLSDDSALPAWLSFDTATQTFSGTPGNAEVGILDVKVTASDGTTTVSDSFVLNINNVNDAPVVANVIADQQVTEDAVFTFTVPAGSFTDIDAGDSLTYSATLSNGSPMPVWLSFDALTQTFTGTPGIAEVGAIDIKVTASDGTTSTSDIFNLTINNVNDAPVVANLITDQQATEDMFFNFTVPAGTFTDPDVGSNLTYGATLSDGSILPAWLSFDALTQNFSGTPGNDEVGVLDVKVIASDGTASISDVFSLTINNVNDAPVVANMISDQQATENTVFSFTVPADSFTDMDVGDVLNYSATLSDGSVLPAWLSFDAMTQTFSGTPTAGQAGLLDVTVTATDGSGASASDVFGLAIDSVVNNSVNNHVYVTGATDDIVSGSTSDDHFMGGAGNDIYEIGADNGSDTIVDTSGINTIRFIDGIVFSDVSSGLVKSGDDLILQIGSLGDQVKIYNFFSVQNTVELLDFASGGQITASQIYGLYGLAAPTQASILGDTLVGGDLVNGLVGTANNDILLSGNGDDTLSGLGGDDQLIGGQGNDTYIISTGNGRDRIIDNDGINTLRFTSDISFNDVASGLVKSGDDLLLQVGSLGDEVRIDNFFALTNTIDSLEFDSGGAITAAQIYGLYGLAAPTETVVTIDHTISNHTAARSQQAARPAVTGTYMIEADSSVMLNNQIDQLVSAMASYNAPFGAGNVIPQEVKDDISIVLAPTW